MNSVGLAVGFAVGRMDDLGWHGSKTTVGVMTAKDSTLLLLHGGHA